MFEKLKLRKNEGSKDLIKKVEISFEDFLGFCKKNTLLILLTILILGLAHGSNLFYNNLGIDTKSFVEHPDFTYNWLGIGRFGLLIERQLLNLTMYSSYYASALFFIFLILSNITLYYAIHKITNKDLGLINLCIPLITFTHPIWVEQFIFMLQIAEISMTIFFTALTILFIYSWIMNKSIVSLMLGIAGMILCFASYQSFVAIYITICIFAFIMLHENEERNESSFITIFKLIGSFIVGFLLYRLILSKLPSDPGYIESSFFWGSRTLEEIWGFISANILEVILARGNYYNCGYLLGAILFVGTIIYNICRNKKLHKVDKVIWYSLSGIALIMTPFLMTFAIGHAPLIRAQLILPFTEGFLIMFALYVLKDKKILKILPLLLIVYIFEQQLYYTETFYYTDKLRNESDIRTTHQIAHDIGKVGVKEGANIAVIGHRDARLNPTCITGESVGISIYTLNYGVTPYYVHTNAGIVGLLQCLGYNYEEAEVEQIAEARKIAQSMPVWPQEGSIKIEDGYVIVKISEDEMPLE